MLFDKLFAKSQNADIENAKYLLMGARCNVRMARVSENEDDRHSLLWYTLEHMLEACYYIRDIGHFITTLSLMRNLGLVVEDDGAFAETCDIVKELINDIADKAGIEL